MRKDILKEFVSENRNAFDDQEPGLDIFNKIQSKLGLQQPVAAPKTKVIGYQYWWAAAAIILVIIGIAVLSQQNKTMEKSIAKKIKSNSIIPTNVIDKKDPAVAIQPTTTDIAKAEQKIPIIKEQNNIVEKKQVVSIGSNSDILAGNTIINDWRKELQSASSSTRLAAVLSSGKESDLSNDDLQALASTMDNDESSNVRLAALEILKKQENQEAAKHLILQSVARQDDPVVQMELLASLSPDEATKVKQDLLAITQNSTNIDAVRNQAYAALLSSKSDF